jgi:predicted amidohydrolase YtcJ
MAARLTAYLVALIVAVTLIAGLIVGAQRDDDGPVDLIVYNGHVYTADGKGTMAEAVAVQGNKILRVGSNREIQRLRRAQTVLVDARGGAVLPGFIDAHAQLLGGGLALGQLNLLNVGTLPEIEIALKNWVENNPNRAWITGRGWHDEPFVGTHPSRQFLDSIVPDRPAYLTARDGHTAWANSAALQLAGITRRTPNPAGGAIVKDPRTGEPTGLLRETAMDLVAARIPKPSRAEQISAIRAAIREAHRHGVTSIQSPTTSVEELELYDALRRNGSLNVRIHAAVAADGSTLGADEIDRLEELRAKYPDGPLFKTGAVAIVADGAITSHAAAMLAPYEDRPTVTGEPRLTATALNEMVTELDKRGWQVMVHAIGDRAVRMALDAFEHAIARNPAPARGRRHRVEHVETIDPEDLPRFGKLGVIASMQPSTGVPETSRLEALHAAIGEDRASRGWAYRSIARLRGLIAFGSNWPTGILDPLLGLHVAVNRTTSDELPAGGWVPGERVTLQQAIDAYTRTAAWASFDEQRKGSLSRDMLADLVILSTDIFEMRPDRLGQAEVAVTIFDGKVVYQRSRETDD